MSLPSERDEGQDYEGDRLWNHRFGEPCQDPGPEVRPCVCVTCGIADAMDRDGNTNTARVLREDHCYNAPAQRECVEADGCREGSE